MRLDRTHNRKWKAFIAVERLGENCMIVNRYQISFSPFLSLEVILCVLYYFSIRCVEESAKKVVNLTEILVLVGVREHQYVKLFYSDPSCPVLPCTLNTVDFSFLGPFLWQNFTWIYKWILASFSNAFCGMTKMEFLGYGKAQDMVKSGCLVSDCRCPF